MRNYAVGFVPEELSSEEWVRFVMEECDGDLWELFETGQVDIQFGEKVITYRLQVTIELGAR